MKDDSPMPFGKHKGKPMSEVPAMYLIWLRDQDWIAEKFEDLAEYIETSYEVLKAQAIEEKDRA